MPVSIGWYRTFEDHLYREPATYSDSLRTLLPIIRDPVLRAEARYHIQDDFQGVQAKLPNAQAELPPMTQPQTTIALGA